MPTISQKNDNARSTERSKTDRNILKLSLRKVQASIKRALVVDENVNSIPEQYQQLRCTTSHCVNTLWFKTASQSRVRKKWTKKSPLNRDFCSELAVIRNQLIFALSMDSKAFTTLLKLKPMPLRACQRCPCRKKKAR